MISNRKNVAFGAPGMAPRWTSGAKDAVGTAYSIASKVWFTAVRGCLTEVYYPTIDTPQIRDLQFLITDGETFFHEERRALVPTVHPLENGALGVSVTMSDPEGRYKLRKEIISDPFQATVLMNVTVDAGEEMLKKLRVYALCAPHLNIGGAHNNGEVVQAQGRMLLSAFRDDTHLAMGATLPFKRTSVGYVGVTDGWQDISDNLEMNWDFDYAPDGNIALTGELDLSKGTTFTLGLSFGDTRQSAVATLFQSLSAPFEMVRERFVKEWGRTGKRMEAVRSESQHDGHLFATSVNLLLAHEDKSYPGALIASLSIPWGELKGDEDTGGYHLVWPRDLCQSATALLSLGDTATPLRSLIYLTVTQLGDGCFYQNFWIDGDPYWKGVQLDEVAFPIMLGWRLKQAGALSYFDPAAMVKGGLAFLMCEGPVTNQDRWEEASGYSPSTLAAVIAALICGAEFLREVKEDESAEFVEEYADFLNANLEKWTVTTEGTLDADIKRHFIRVNAVSLDKDGYSDEDPNRGTLRLANQAPGAQVEYPAKEIVDAGFLELVRYGIRRAGDPLFEDSLKVVDTVLKVDLPQGPGWRRYNHDGYGQRADGTGYDGWGVGRAWPLLTGERAHYELDAGRDAVSLLKTYEKFGQGLGLFPEQVWDSEEQPNSKLYFGAPTGSAIPLVWAHAEYIKLVRSIELGHAVDRIAPVYDRYVGGSAPESKIEVWSTNRRPRSIATGKPLRIIYREDFMVRWTTDDWKTQQDTDAIGSGLALHYVDIPVLKGDGTLRFTLFWKDSKRWEGRDYSVNWG